MPTTNVNINHRLSADGFDGRASHALKPGSTNDTSEMHRDTQGLEICLHPAGPSVPRAVAPQLPDALPYSADIKAQYNSLTDRLHMRYLGKGTDSASISVEDCRERISNNDILLDKLVLPNDILPTLENKNIDVLNSERTIFSSSEAIELKNGTDANIDRGSDIGSGITLRLGATCGLSGEEEVETFSFDDLYDVVPVTTRHYRRIKPAGPAAAPSYYAQNFHNRDTGMDWEQTQNVGNTGFPISSGMYLPGSTPTFENSASSNTYSQVLPSPLMQFISSLGVDSSESAAATNTRNAHNAALTGWDEPMSIITSASWAGFGTAFNNANFPDNDAKPAGIGVGVDDDYIDMVRNSAGSVSVVKPKGLDMQMGASQYTPVDVVASSTITLVAPGALEFKAREEWRQSSQAFVMVAREYNNTAGDWSDSTSIPPATVTVPQNYTTRTFTFVDRRSELQQGVMDETLPTYRNTSEFGGLAGQLIPGGYSGLFTEGTWNLWGDIYSAGFDSVMEQGLVDPSLRIAGLTLCAFHTYSGKHIPVDSIFRTDGFLNGTVYDPNGTPQNFIDARLYLANAINNNYTSPEVLTGSGPNTSSMHFLWGCGTSAPYAIRMNLNKSMVLTGTASESFPPYLTHITPSLGYYSEHMLGGLPATGAFADPNLDLTVGDSPGVTSPWTNYLPSNDNSGVLLLPAANEGFSGYGNVNFGVSGNIIQETTGISFRSNLAIITSDSISDVHVDPVVHLPPSFGDPNGIITAHGRNHVYLSVGSSITDVSDPTTYPDPGLHVRGESTASIAAEITSVATHSDVVQGGFLSSLNTWGSILHPPNFGYNPQLSNATPAELYTDVNTGVESIRWYQDQWPEYDASLNQTISDIKAASKAIHDDQAAFLNGTSGDDAKRGIVRAVNHLALLATDNNWVSIPSNPGTTEVPGSRWFDWKKMATDLLHPSQVSRFNARLAEGVFDTVLPGPESMIAVFEAVTRVLAEDYVDGINGYDGIDLGPFYDRNTAIAEAPAPNGNTVFTLDEQLELFRSTEVTVNLRFASAVSNVFGELNLATPSGDVGMIAMLHWLKEESKNTSVANVSASDLLRTSSIDGLVELACAYSLFASIARSSDDGSAMTRVLGLVFDAADNFMGTYGTAPHADNFQYSYTVSGGGSSTVTGDPVTIILGGEGTLAGPYLRVGFDQTILPQAHLSGSHPFGSAVDAYARSSGYTDTLRCASGATLVDPRDGVTKTIGSMAIPHLGNLNPAQPFSTVTTNPVYSANQWADPTYVKRHVIFPDQVQSYPQAVYPADAPLGFHITADSGIGFSMNFRGMKEDPTNLDSITSVIGQSLTGKPDQITVYPQSRVLTGPRYVTLPYGFNLLDDDTTLLSSVSPVELGIAPGIEMAQDIPAVNSKGEVSYTGLSTATQGTRNWVVDRAEPHMFPVDATGDPYRDTLTVDVIFNEEGTDTNGVPYDRTASIPVHLPMDGLHDPALLTATPTSLALNWVDPDDRSATGTWSANGNYVFDGRATMDLFNRDRNAGMFIDSGPGPLTMYHNVGNIGPARTDYADDSLFVRKFKAERDALASEVAAVDTFVLTKAPADGSTGGFDNFPNDTILSAHEALQSALPASVSLSGTHSYELSVYPLEDVDIRYYAYDVSGETKYMYPVYLTATEAEAADTILDGQGESVAYGVNNGGAPSELTSQSAIDNFNGVVLYQTSTNDTDIRENFNRYKMRSTHPLFRNGDNSGMLDTFFVDYPAVVAGTLFYPKNDPNDPDEPEVPVLLDEPIDATHDPLTWEQLAALMTDLTMGGDVNDPDPGRRLGYVMGTLEGRPQSVGSDEQMTEALTPRGARLASKFKPGWMWGGSVAGWDAVEWRARGAARVSAGVTSYGQVPQDNPYTIDYTYVAEFVPFSGMTTLRITS